MEEERKREYDVGDAVFLMKTVDVDGQKLEVPVRLVITQIHKNKAGSTYEAEKWVGPVPVDRLITMEEAGRKFLESLRIVSSSILDGLPSREVPPEGVVDLGKEEKPKEPVAKPKEKEEGWKPSPALSNETFFEVNDDGERPKTKEEMLARRYGTK